MTSFPPVKYSRWDLITVSNLGDTGNDVLCKTNHHTWLFLGLRSLKYRNFQIKTKKKRERKRERERGFNGFITGTANA